MYCVISPIAHTPTHMCLTHTCITNIHKIAYQTRALNLHNQYRQKHHAPALQMDNQVGTLFYTISLKDLY